MSGVVADRERGGAGVELLAELVSSKVRAAVLGHLLPRPHLGFSLTDLSRLLGLPISSLQHECYKLARLGILRDERAGSARRYRPDPACLLLVPLSSLVATAIGAEAALRAATEGVPGLEAAFLAGALPPRPPSTEPARLVLVGELSVEAVDAIWARVAVVLDPILGPGQVELAFFRPADWEARRGAGNRYLADLLAGPRLPLLDPPNSPDCPPADASQT